MLNESLIKLFERDLDKLLEEISLFMTDEDLWITPGAIKNSPGNLSLHICGNLKYFIGATLGESGYEREREREFSLRNVPREELIQNIEETKNVVIKTISKLDQRILELKYPIDVFGKEMTTEYFLIHLTTHLNYHLGQINYLRRILID